MLAKIKNGYIIFPPPSDASMECQENKKAGSEHGYREMSDEDLAQAVIDLIHPPVRYSQLKIIKALGPQWENIRKELENSQLLDDFFSVENIAENNLIFLPLLSKIKNILQDRMQSCII